jgi:membrane protein DedA with SNARE-associated domain
MGYGRFVALATLGSIVWITALAVLGRAVGKQWSSWRHHLEYVDYAAVALVIVAVIYLVLRRRRRPDGDDPGGLVPGDTAHASMDVVSR